MNRRSIDFTALMSVLNEFLFRASPCRGEDLMSRNTDCSHQRDGLTIDDIALSFRRAGLLEIFSGVSASVWLER